MSSFCCADCFDDRGLRNTILAVPGCVPQTCNFCGTKEARCLPPRELPKYFEFEWLEELYVSDPDGKPLAEWVQADWTIFSQAVLNAGKAAELLGEILGDANLATRLVSPATSGSEHEGLNVWENFRQEMMHKNRWFPDAFPDMARLADLLSHLNAYNLPKSWYRARRSNNGQAYSKGDMGAPPQRLAPHGRANPAGIPYLYLASCPATAIAEVRPYQGEVAYVADFTITGPSGFVDLRAPRKLVSPFLLENLNATTAGELRADLPFLERLGEELTRPVHPSGAAFNYVPSQYLCEFIKKCGYNGVIYRSSATDGINLALFRTEQAVIGTVKPYSITKVSVAATAGIEANQ